MGFWVTKAVAFGSLAGLGVLIYRETGVATAASVVVILVAIMGLDRRTRGAGGIEQDAWARLTREIEGMQPDPDRVPGSGEEGEPDGDDG